MMVYGWLVYGDSLNVLPTVVCFEIFHNKRVKMKIMLHTCGLKLSILPNCKPRSTLKSIFICTTSFDLDSNTESPLPDYPFFRPESHSEDRRGIVTVQIPNWRMLLTLGIYSFTHPLASSRQSRSGTVKVLSSSKCKGLILSLTPAMTGFPDIVAIQVCAFLMTWFRST